MVYVGHVFIKSAEFKPVVRNMCQEELESEQRWSTLFANSQDALAKLAEKARIDYLAGNTELLDPENL